MRLKVTLAYDGSEYSGWGIQDNVLGVQEVVEKALSKIAKHPIRIHASGRTDADVHALAQVFHFDTDLEMPTDAWIRAINALTDDGILIKNVEKVSDEFHARFHAISKTYSYHLNMGDKNIFNRKYELQYGKPLNIELMKEAMELIIGTHDFTSFNSTELAIMPDQVRTIYTFDLLQEGQKLVFRIHGDGFLRYMVRRLIGSIVAVGEGTLTVNEFKQILEAKDKMASRYKIHGCGLYLEAVEYGVIT